MEIIKRAKIKVEDEWIDIKIPISFLTDALRKTKNWNILDKVRGMWKNKKIDALEYQKRMSQEWK